jgi:recombinational DNA repair protein (RecF pathway)
MSETKVCTKCGEEKELSEFSKKHSGKLGVDSRCKLCLKIIHAKSYRLSHSKPIFLNHRFTKRIAKELYITKKKSSGSIAKLFNCTRKSILYYLRKYKIKIRSNSEAQKNYGHKGKNNANYKHGNCCTKHYCVDCGKKIDKFGRSKRCPKCAKIFKPPQTKHNDKTKKLIGQKSKEKFTPEYIENIHKKHEGIKRKNNHDYIMVKKYSHPNKNSGNLIGEHRLKMERHLGRILTKNELIHHINFVRNDNKINNLYLCKNRSHHSQIHANISKLVPILFKNRIILFKNGNYKINGKYIHIK